MALAEIGNEHSYSLDTVSFEIIEPSTSTEPAHLKYFQTTFLPFQPLKTRFKIYSVRQYLKNFSQIPFYLINEGDFYRRGLKVKCNLKFCSIPTKWIEIRNEKIHTIEKSDPIPLFTAFLDNRYFTVSGKSLEMHDYAITMKCDLIFYVDPVLAKRSMQILNETLKGSSIWADYKNLYDSKEMSDLTIILKKDSLLAHKFVLMTRSPVFKAMLSNDCLESNTRTIEITDVDATVFDNFLQYLYYGEISEKSSDTLQNLYVLADKYAVDGLKKVCRDMLIADMNVDSAFKLLELPCLFTDGTLKFETIYFLKNNFSAISRKEEWRKMCKENPELASEVLRMVTDMF